MTHATHDPGHDLAANIKVLVAGVWRPTRDASWVVAGDAVVAFVNVGLSLLSAPSVMNPLVHAFGADHALNDGPMVH